MPFATRSDLLERADARRLAQMAVPSDREMPPVEALRVAIGGGDLTGYSTADQASLIYALSAIDQALADADELIQSYGVPASVQTPLLARLASTIALFYLQGDERQSKDITSAYDGAIRTLREHANGTLNLIPASPADPASEVDACTITSGRARYGVAATADGDWETW